MSFWPKSSQAGPRRGKAGKVDFSKVLEDDGAQAKPAAVKPAEPAARKTEPAAKSRKAAAPESPSKLKDVDAPVFKPGKSRAERKKAVKLGALKPAKKAKKPFSLVIGAGSVVSVLALMLLLLAWGGGMTMLLIFGDRLSSKLIAQSSEMQDAYEQRLQAYRDEIARVVSEAEQTKVDSNSITGRVIELTKKQRMIESRQAILNKLAEQIGGDAAAASAAAGAAQPASSTAPPPPPTRPTFPTRPSTPGQTRGDATIPQLFPTETADATPDAGDANPAPSITRPVRLASSDPSDSLRYAQLLEVPQIESGPSQEDLENEAQVDRLMRAVSVIENQQIQSLNGFARLSDIRIIQMRGALTILGLTPEELAPDNGRSAASMPGFQLPLNEQNTPFGQRISQIRTNSALLFRLGPALKAMPIARPTHETRFASPFGYRVHPIYHTQKLHAGMDLAAPMGTPIVAAGAGVVLSAGWAGGYGNMVQIDHGNGVITRYGHMSEIDVTQGQPLQVGGLVGKVGSTGASTGPHLHFETRLRGTPYNPACFLIAGDKLRNGNSTGMNCDKPPFSHRPPSEEEDDDDSES
ncbi:M23 family metallopeptidase [Terrarubrum flagellatum]|uniref:M23 family metallopeptidase n=1 Tax=Terrirubrum flagellatum TaxID=2895980 RepID=UPI003144F248